MRRRDSIPAFKAERWGADKSPVWLSHSMAFCGVWVWETSEPTCLGPFSTAQICQSMPLREDVRALQDCVCKLNLSWLLSSSSCRKSANAAEIGHMQKRPTTTVDFHVGGGVGHQLWWGAAVSPNLSPQPVLSFVSRPALFYGFICFQEKAFARVWITTTRFPCGIKREKVHSWREDHSQSSSGVKINWFNFMCWS